MNYGQAKNTALRLMDEYSSRGAILAPNKTADIRYKFQEAANDAIYDLAQTTGRLPATYRIAHNPVLNELARDRSSIKKHIPGTDETMELQGARAAYFECNGPATVLIEERQGANWVTLVTVDVPATVTEMAQYKRLINPSSNANMVRLRFSGNYLYDYRNYTLYPYLWPSEDAIQSHSNFIEYPLPKDFMILDSLMCKKDQRQYMAMTADYQIRRDKILAVNKYLAPVEILLHYYRKPQLLIFTGDDSVDDLQSIDLSEDAARIVPYAMAAAALISEGETAKGALLLNLVESKKGSLPGNTFNYQSTIQNIFQW